MRHSSLLFVIAAVVLVGGGCDRLAERHGVRPEDAPAPAAVQQVKVTRENIDLMKHEVVLRSIDTGIAETTGQRLFARVGNGDMIEMIPDVHAALGKDLSELQFLVHKRDVPASFRYAYFTTQCAGLGCDENQVFVFDKQEKRFLTDGALVEKLKRNGITSYRFSPDHKWVARLDNVEAEAHVVEIIDLEKLQVTHQWALPAGATFFEKLDDKNAAVISVETKWASPELFQVAWFKMMPEKKSARTSEDVMVIPVTRVVQDRAALAVSTTARYAYDHVTNNLYVQHADGYSVLAAADLKGADGAAISANSSCGELVNEEPGELLQLHVVCYTKATDGPSPAVWRVFDRKKLTEDAQATAAFGEIAPGSSDVAPDGNAVAIHRGTAVEIFSLISNKKIADVSIPEGFTTVSHIVTQGGELPSEAPYYGGSWISKTRYRVELFKGEPTVKGRKPTKTQVISAAK